MELSCLQHLLTPAERAAFARDGYLIIREALTPATVDRLRALAVAHYEEFLRGPDITEFHVMNEHDLVGKEPEWLELVDNPATFAKVWGVMGWNIQLFHTQLIVTPPAQAGATAGTYGWHQDNNRMNRDFDTELHPMVSVKVGYFLSDMSRPGMANLNVVTGSHRLARAAFTEADCDPLELTARAGDAVLFDRRLWHAASTNCSNTARLFLTYGYSYRWLRTKSAMKSVPPPQDLDDIRRQLLGHATSSNGYFEPQPDDVPLRQWIETHVGADAVAP